MKPYAAWFLFLCIFSVSVAGRVAAEDALPLGPKQLDCLQEMIFFNECSCRPERMLTWRADEDFPSFGLGHFIWYPKGKKGPYRALFPEFLSYLEKREIAIPAWIVTLPTREAPWQDRKEFLDDLSSERMTSLKNFLDRTRGYQTEFMVQRIEGVLPRMLATVPEQERPAIELKFKEISEAPSGMFALIDYVNFKGEGILETERAQGQGWGLLQVLEAMQVPEKKEAALKEFVRAAVKVLEARARNAPSENHYSERLGGWKARVRNYEKIKC